MQLKKINKNEIKEKNDSVGILTKYSLNKINKLLNCNNVLIKLLFSDEKKT